MPDLQNNKTSLFAFTTLRFFNIKRNVLVHSHKTLRHSVQKILFSVYQIDSKNSDLCGKKQAGQTLTQKTDYLTKKIVCKKAFFGYCNRKPENSFRV